MNREELLARITGHGEPWDIVVIGGGATGAGIALDAASRGHDVLLLEARDFAQGTSSRSTKLAHGGVRYLEQGNVALVMEALKERGLMRRNAPHLVHDLAFVVPSYDWWEAPFYGVGLKLYNLLAGKYGFGPSRMLSREETLARIPTLKLDGLRGGVQYYDGQFDDARLLINIVQTAHAHGATLLNHAPVTALLRDAEGYVNGVLARDAETGAELRAGARVIVNATGAFADGVRRLADAGVAPIIAPSQGVHLVFDRAFLPGDAAIMVPHTSDGRVLFAIPWHGRTLVGTTDTPLPSVDEEPRAQEQEIDFILDTAAGYLHRAPTRADVRSCFAGIRPLVRAGDAHNTSTLSRGHVIHIDGSGLLTIAGGKWTTYRNMAEDCVNQAETLGHLDDRPCVTKELRIHGWHEHAEDFGPLAVYGADAPAIMELQRARPELAVPLAPAVRGKASGGAGEPLPFTGAEVVWAVRQEAARTVQDVLARRTRALFLDARAARAMAPRVAELLAGELGRDRAWAQAQVRDFETLAERYTVRVQATG